MGAELHSNFKPESIANANRNGGFIERAFDKVYDLMRMPADRQFRALLSFSALSLGTIAVGTGAFVIAERIS